jgi:diguanylate cyclase (GGDEF)-like protein/PAS domain S-box-containing protein
MSTFKKTKKPRKPADTKRELEFVKKLHSAFISILDNMDAIVYVTDIKTHEILYINDYTKNIFGEIEGEICWQVLQVDQSGPCSFCSNDKLFTPEGRPAGVYHWEFQNTRNGKWYDIRDRAIKWIDGRLVRLEIATDITQRKNDETQLVENEKKYRSLINSMNSGFAYHRAVFDEQGKPVDYIFLEVNDYFEKVTGLQKEKLIGRRVTEVIPGIRDSAFNWIKTYGEVAVTGRETSFEQYLEHFGKWFSVSAYSPIKGHFAAIFTDITGRKHMEQQILSTAITDELTDLYNRRGFFTLAEQQSKLADRYKKKISLLYLDLDGLKAINDRLGHKTGDQALRDLAGILKKTFRESDIIARVGGDEFVVLLTEPPDTDIEHSVLKHIQQNIDHHNTMAGRQYELLISIGISHYDPSSPCSIENLMKYADENMYEHKRHHKQNRHSLQPIKAVTGISRMHERFLPDENITAELTVADKTIISDISIGGICLITPLQLPPFETYIIKLRTPFSSVIRQKGCVVWSAPAGTVTGETASRQNYKTGFKFIHLDNDLEKNLMKLVKDTKTD